MNFRILIFNKLPSTQVYLCENPLPQTLILANIQTAGIGSRGNSWDMVDDGLYFSFSIFLDLLPTDLPLASASIYFSYIMKETLNDIGIDVGLKWPNDIYKNDQKIGGVMCNKKGNLLIVGLGVNLKSSEYGQISSTAIDKFHLVDKYLEKIALCKKWKEIFSNYKLEFKNNYKFISHIDDGSLISLGECILNDDGSITHNGKKYYSLR